MPKKTKKKGQDSLLHSFAEQTRHGSTYDVDSKITEATSKSPFRVEARRIRNEENPESWYMKYIRITPAKNTNRPMESVFNSAFTKNGTNGVPRFIDLDVEWIGFADTFMLDQVIYNAMQSIRLSLKSNLPYDDKHVKQCFVNGIVLTVMGKLLERDVHWNLFDSGDDFNFLKMYRLKSDVTGGSGIVDLNEVGYLKDENLPYTSTIYNKIASLFNAVIYLPNSIAEFISHYFGSLFTLDRDGKNDQYLRINMHQMDYYVRDHSSDDPKAKVLSTLDLAGIDIDDYLELLNQYSKDFAVVLADLKKCLGVSRVGLQRYESYTYTFVFDKSLHQALVNGYTSDSLVSSRGFIRMDELADVSDKLTQYLFMGAIQPDDTSKSNVKAISILNMTLKINSDENLQWPATLAERALETGDGTFLVKDKPFGISLITDMTSAAETTVSYDNTQDAVVVQIPRVPERGAIPDAPFLHEAEAPKFYLNNVAGKWPSNGALRRDDDMHNWPGTYSHLIATGIIYLGTVVYFDASGDENYHVRGYFLMAESDTTINRISATSPRCRFKYTFAVDPNVSGVNARVGKEFDELIKSLANSKPQVFIQGFNPDMEEDPQDAINRFVNEAIVPTYPDAVKDGYDTVAIESPDWNGDDPKNGFTFRDDIWGIRGYSSFSTATEFVVTVDIAAPFVDCKAYLCRGTSPVPNGLLFLSSAAITGYVSNSYWSVSTYSGDEGAIMYATQVIDYHLPIAYRRDDSVKVVSNATTIFNASTETAPVLLKEDYIPYYYNVLDLIPTLYEMFVSLFAINAKPRTSRDRNDS